MLTFQTSFVKIDIFTIYFREFEQCQAKSDSQDAEIERIHQVFFFLTRKMMFFFRPKVTNLVTIIMKN